MINWKDYRILVVEDDQALLEVLKDVFAPLCAEVYGAMNGLEAYEIIQREQVDIIISDVQMPYMTGLELLKKVRETDRNIPFILLATGQTSPGYELAAQSEASGLINKPFKFVELKRMIESAVAPGAGSEKKSS